VRFTGKNLLLVYRALISHEMDQRNMLVTAPEHEVDGPSYKEYEAEHLATLKLIDTMRTKFETKENP